MRIVTRTIDINMNPAVVRPYLCLMPNRSLAWMLVLLLLMSVSAKTVLWIDYLARTDFYARTVCVQKEIKDNCCKGSCHLNKELNEQDQREKQSYPTLKMNAELVFITVESLCFQSQHGKNVMIFHPVIEAVLIGTCSEVLRPPIV